MWCIKSVQRRFTKSVQRLHNLSYEERLLQLNALSLINRRLLDEMVFLYKVIHGLFNCSTADLDFHVLHSRNRGDGVQLLLKRTVSRAASNLYSIRSPSAWNKLPFDITSSLTWGLYTFKRKLKKYVLVKFAVKIINYKCYNSYSNNFYVFYSLFKFSHSACFCW